MKVKKADSSYVLILERGEEIHSSLAEFCRSQNLAGAWLSGLGGAASVTLGFYDITSKSYQWKFFDEPLEIVSLTGNLSYKNDEPVWHLHGSFSGPNYQTVSGHVKEMTVGLTAELFIGPINTPLERSFDETTGLFLI